MPVAILIASGFSMDAVARVVPGVKTSQHASFKPGNFERLAVLVKQTQGHMGGMGRGSQGQTDRLIEQGFMRTLIASGYTLVSRTDLDAAMKERGLDDAHMTDEKLTEEAGKLLHVSALLIVSVDDLSLTSTMRQRQRSASNPYITMGMDTVYQFAASISARLVKINDNMVMWTGDMTLDRTLGIQSQENQLLGSMAEAIAMSFPTFPKN